MADLPARPSLDHLRRQARDLLRAARAGDTTAAGRIRAVADALTLASAQLAVAREYGFASRTRLRDEVTARTASLARQAEAFCEASIRDGTGRAARMLAATPELARYSFATAVILGDAGRVRTELGRDPGLATQADTRTGWAPLHAASASRWHRLDPARAEGLLAVARDAAGRRRRPQRPHRRGGRARRLDPAALRGRRCGQPAHHQAAAGARRRARRPRSVPARALRCKPKLRRRCGDVCPLRSVTAMNLPAVRVERFVGRRAE